MAKRVQVTLTDAEYAALYTLSELRGQSMSMIISGPISRALPGWKAEISELHELRRKEAAIAERIRKVSSR